MKEVSGAVVGIVLVLLAVFIPTAFIGGITGQLYKQFALTIAISTVISGFNALTLCPVSETQTAGQILSLQSFQPVF